MLTNMEHQGSYHAQNIQTYNDERNQNINIKKFNQKDKDKNKPSKLGEKKSA